MPLKPPREGHPIRELIDCAEVVAMTPTAYKLLPSVEEARAERREYYRANKTAEPSHLLVRGNDNQVLLVTFGPKGGYPVRWNFGRPDWTHHKLRAVTT